MRRAAAREPQKYKRQTRQFEFFDSASPPSVPWLIMRIPDAALPSPNS